VTGDPATDGEHGPIDPAMVALGAATQIGDATVRWGRTILRPAWGLTRWAASSLAAVPSIARRAERLEERGNETLTAVTRDGPTVAAAALDQLAGAVVGLIDMEVLVAEVTRRLPAESLVELIDGVLGAIDPQSALPLVEGVVRTVSEEAFGPLVDRVVRQVDPAAPAALVDGVVEALDLDELVEGVVERLDLQELALAVVARLDLDPVVDSALTTVDVPALVQRLELSDLVLAETGGVVGDAVGFVRTQGMTGDELITRAVNRVLRRRGARAELAPVARRPLGLPPGDTDADD
jgi:hypothetical protein